MDSVLIVSPPQGEAPDWVREAWVGLRLPTKDGRGARRYLSAGVLTGPDGVLPMLLGLVTGRTNTASGYYVPSQEALAILDAARPEAAAWWRAQAPRFFKRGHAFLFDDAACRPG